MTATVYAGEHKGQRLVERRSPRGDNLYRLPEGWADRPVSECIRALSRAGWSRSEISKVTGIRYQHVRNVLEDQGPASKARIVVVDDDAPVAQGIEEGEIGSLIAFADVTARVERGEEITVVRQGLPVARIVPFRAIGDSAALEEAMARMDERRKGLSLRGLSVKELINEGRP